MRLVRSNAVTLGPASSEFATRPLRINERVFERFVAEAGATRGRDARTVLSRISTRDFVALQDALRYLDRVGAAGRAGLGRTAQSFGRGALSFGGSLATGGPLPVRVVGAVTLAAGGLAWLYSQLPEGLDSFAQQREANRRRVEALRFHDFADSAAEREAARRAAASPEARQLDDLFLKRSNEFYADLDRRVARRGAFYGLAIPGELGAGRINYRDFEFDPANIRAPGDLARLAALRVTPAAPEDLARWRASRAFFAEEDIRVGEFYPHDCEGKSAQTLSSGSSTETSLA